MASTLKENNLLLLEGLYRQRSKEEITKFSPVETKMAKKQSALPKTFKERSPYRINRCQGTFSNGAS